MSRHNAATLASAHPTHPKSTPQGRLAKEGFIAHDSSTKKYGKGDSEYWLVLFVKGSIFILAVWLGWALANSKALFDMPEYLMLGVFLLFFVVV